MRIRDGEIQVTISTYEISSENTQSKLGLSKIFDGQFDLCKVDVGEVDCHETYIYETFQYYSSEY